MNQQLSHDNTFTGRQSPATWYWSGVVLAVAVLMGFVEYFETDILTPSISLDQLYTFKAAGYANLFLVASSLLYLIDFLLPSKGFGKWATGVAGIGAAGSVLALVIRWIETYFLHRPGHLPLNALYEAMAFFIAATVVIYLVMEQAYKTRAAGPFVMLIVLCAVSYQIWLTSTGQALVGSRIPVVRSYWMYAHVLGTFVGYGAFAVAAGMGTAYLLRSGAGDTSWLGDLGRIDRSMHYAILVGFPVFTIATVLGGLWAYEAWGRYWAWDPKEIWALVVWCIYASYFYFRNIRRWPPRGMAWWSIFGFAGTVFCFLGVRVLWPGLHAYG